MKKPYALLCILCLLISVTGCTGGKKYHKTDMPDPKGYNAHFGDMDQNGDEAVTWQEFLAYFPDATEGVYKALDLNRDGSLDHDEWHEFKEAHGLRDHD